MQEKSGDSENKVQSIEGICRLICMAKSSQPLKVYIGKCPLVNASTIYAQVYIGP